MLAILWAIFTVIFLAVAIFHLMQAREQVPLLKDFHRPYGGFEGGFLREIDKPLKRTQDDLNTFIKNLNRSNRRINVMESAGYFTAAFTAFVSMLIELHVLGG